jgi:hypothetical protein
MTPRKLSGAVLELGLLVPACCQFTILLKSLRQSFVTLVLWLFWSRGKLDSVVELWLVLGMSEVSAWVQNFAMERGRAAGNFRCSMP